MIFKLPQKAQGKLTESSVDTDIAIESNPESHAGHSGEHGKEHHHADEHERHSDFKAEYRFVCKRPEKLTQIEVMLFRIFPGIEQIEVQILTETKQTALKLTPKKNRIVF
jgi:hypothetical protein